MSGRGMDREDIGHLDILSSFSRIVAALDQKNNNIIKAVIPEFQILRVPVRN